MAVRPGRGFVILDEVTQNRVLFVSVGVSSESGLRATWIIFSTFLAVLQGSANSSTLGSCQVFGWLMLDAQELVNLIAHVDRTRIVRPWSAIARVTAWRIHQVA